MAAVYGVPDDQAGDQVMAGLVVTDDGSLDPAVFAAWLDAQDAIGPKWRPRYLRVLHDPPPVPRLIQFSDHGMDLELRFWIADPQNGVNNVRSDVNLRIWRLFRDAGITIPVTQHEVRVLKDHGAP